MYIEEENKIITEVGNVIILNAGTKEEIVATMTFDREKVRYDLLCSTGLFIAIGLNKTKLFRFNSIISIILEN